MRSCILGRITQEERVVHLLLIPISVTESQNHTVIFSMISSIQGTNKEVI